MRPGETEVVAGVLRCKHGPIEYVDDGAPYCPECDKELASASRPVTEAADDDLGIRLSDTWLAEQASWHVDFDEGAHVSWPWTVVLEWTSERDNPHHADWVTYTWQFYGETVERALTEAVEWCEAVAAFAIEDDE